jgi:hypothetical protein
MSDFLKRHDIFDDEKKAKFVEAIAAMLEIQLVPVRHLSIESPDGQLNGKALGYIYGFIDAALRAVGQDMSETEVGIPVTFQVLRRVFPGREEKYLAYLADHMGTDEAVTLGAMAGGQQYLDFNAGKLSASMGLARAILNGV